ncbi:MAG: hypothetical protein LBQ94_03995 [Treponema sp.]|nr:hypothetical protein [Treponema sp.]
MRITQGTLLAPIRPVADLMNAEVRGNDETQPITIIYENTAIAIAINNINMTVLNRTTGESRTVTLPVEPTIYDGVAFFPVEAVARALGATVTWVEITNTIHIMTPGYVPAPPQPPGNNSGGGDTVPGNNLAEKLRWLQNNAQSNHGYIVEVTANESITNQWLEYNDRSSIIITLRGVGANRTISLPADDGAVFSIHSGVTLVLDNNITLQGRSSNTDTLVNVFNGGTFRMNTGSAIIGNIAGEAIGVGGGVYVGNGAAFTMGGGTISGNSANWGGGVYVSNGATFTMSGGTISGNSANRGGGVCVGTSTTFTMSGGTISGNTADDASGGVEVFGSFTMNGGNISRNTAPRGGGVTVFGGAFTMSNGTVSGNTANNGRGGGVLVGTSSTTDGGAIEYGTFTMRGGTISGNTASDYGGGVYVSSSCTFNKTGGTITGYASDTNSGNRVRNSAGAIQSNRGHAVYISSSIRKETTAGPEANLSYNGRANPPTFSGAWNN